MSIWLMQKELATHIHARWNCGRRTVLCASQIAAIAGTALDWAKVSDEVIVGLDRGKLKNLIKRCGRSGRLGVVENEWHGIGSPRVGASFF